MSTIFFNNSVILQSGFDIYKAIEVDVDGPLAPYNYSWYLANANFHFEGLQTDRFEIIIDYLDSQLLGHNLETLTLCLRTSAQIKHFRCNKYLDETPCFAFPLYYGKEAPIEYCHA